MSSTDHISLRIPLTGPAVPEVSADDIWNEVLKRSVRPGVKQDSLDPPMINSRRRIVLRQWPRAPDGPIIKTTPDGKEAGNGWPLWGATLMDFYHVRRIPAQPSLITIASGSRLAAWAREVGELKVAEEEIMWADNEAEPVELHPWSVADLIELTERRAGWGAGGWKSREPPITKEDGASIFGAMQPSDYVAAPPTLQQIIPYHLLPQKLVVHDPDATLSVGNGNGIGGTRTYRLELSTAGKKKATEDREQWAKRAAEQESRLLASPIPMEPGEMTAPIILTLPPAPALEETSEAHLYLHKDRALGQGNHSVIYNGEFEVPRAVLVPPVHCRLCASADAHAQIKKEEEMRTERARCTDSSGGLTSDELSTRMGQVTIEEELVPSADITLVHGNQLKGTAETTHTHQRGEPSKPAVLDAHESTPPSVHKLQDQSTIRTAAYDGPVHRVKSQVAWQFTDRPTCPHLSPKLTPPTATVKVAVKLSLQGDNHIVREARNYQEFPRHMFQHWSGYNVFPPLHDPVPVGAVVPQFYGYYIPEPIEGENEKSDYLSPIMLLENCGKPIDPRELNVDDRQECASLLYRLHAAGYIHNSVFERNIVMQLGDLQDYPLAKKASDRRFRLIDFGRTQKAEPSARSKEEDDAAVLLKLLHHADC